MAILYIPQEEVRVGDHFMICPKPDTYEDRGVIVEITPDSKYPPNGVIFTLDNGNKCAVTPALTHAVVDRPEEV